MRRGGQPALAALGAAAVALLLETAAVAQEPANTLMDLRRQFGLCLGGTPLRPPGSRVTIVFMLKRDGSIFGRPRITFSRLEGDSEQKRRFLSDAEHAVDSCLPLKVTPGLGAAIAGRMFSITLGRERPERAI